MPPINKNTPEQPEQPESSLLMNIARFVFLIVVLVVAWFVLEWLMGR
jgi:uncharacterized protein HemY